MTLDFCPGLPSPFPGVLAFLAFLAFLAVMAVMAFHFSLSLFPPPTAANPGGHGPTCYETSFAAGLHTVPICNAIRPALTRQFPRPWSSDPGCTVCSVAIAAPWVAYFASSSRLCSRWG
ncbi:hypothetical protein GQ53DRAFT_751965 [Thozetella sp. PMI_491]|nr:hypothetical protein GQ53DRAFT_751965 [Thozetella sp. PMI_491]